MKSSGSSPTHRTSSLNITRQVTNQGGASNRNITVRKESQRMDFLQKKRKLSSQAFPLMGSGDPGLSKEEVYDFENKLRDLVAQLIKPIYDKIQDTLASLRTIKGSQDEVSRQTKEIEFQVQEFSQYGNKMDDIKGRIQELREEVNSIAGGTTRRIEKVQTDFYTLKTEFKKEEEQSRVARKCFDKLQDEYCRIVHSVVSEKQRNLMYIEKAKREFQHELTGMAQQVLEIDVAKKKITELDTRMREKEKQMQLENEMFLYKVKLDFDRKIEALELKHVELTKKFDEQAHQLEMFGRETHRIEKEVQHTDYFLNKVQPISLFTNQVTLLRSIIEDEDQLDRIKQLQDQFFQELAADQEELKQYLSEESDKLKDGAGAATSGDDQMNEDDIADMQDTVMFSPHYERIAAALKEVENIKKKDASKAKRPPSILLGDELQRFEGLLKKIQNHREIADVVEMKIEEIDRNGQNQSKAEPEVESQHVIYVQGKRKTVTPVEMALKTGSSKDLKPPNARSGHNPNRRSQSELNNVGLNSDYGAQSPTKPNPLALDLVDVIGMDRSAHDQQPKMSRMSERSLRGRRSNRRSSRRPVINRTRQSGSQQQSRRETNHGSLTNKMRDGSTMSSHDLVIEVRASDLQDEDIKELGTKYDMVEEKFEITQTAMNLYQKQFSIKGTVCDRVTAFKLGINDTEIREQRRMTVAVPRSGIKVQPLATLGDKQSGQPLEQPVHQPRIVTRKKSSTKSFRGKIVKAEEKEDKIRETSAEQDATPLLQRQLTDLGGKTLTKDELLASYIGQQIKLNEFHEQIVSNMLADRQHQDEIDEDQSSEAEEDQSASRGATSSLQDEMEAMDSVQMDANLNLGSDHHAAQDQNGNNLSIAITKLSTNYQANNVQHNETTPKNANDTVSKRHSMTQKSDAALSNTLVSKKSHSRTSNNLDAHQLRNTAHKTIKRVNRQESVMTGMLSKRSRGMSGGASVSMRGRSKIGRFGEKNAILMKKDMEKKIKKAIAEECQLLTEQQTLIVADMIKSQVQPLEKQTKEKTDRLDAQLQSAAESMNVEQAKMRDLEEIMEQTQQEFSKVCQNFREQQDRYEVCIKKMVVDKRATVQVCDNLQIQIDTIRSIQLIVRSFITDIATRVNHLLTAEEIDIRLYAQDDVDRQMTTLYGINEEMGSNDLKSQSVIQVNKNCMQCSGNASFIKKAFKLACLSYQSSKVSFQNQEFTREELLFKRQKALDSASHLSIEGLHKAIETNELNRCLKEEQGKRVGRKDLSNHLRESYTPINRAVLQQIESHSTFNNNDGANRMSFRDVNNSTVKLEDGSPQKQQSGVPTPSLRVTSDPDKGESKQHTGVVASRNSEAMDAVQEAPLLNNKIYSRRGQSAHVSKKLSVKDTVPINRDMESTLPVVQTPGKGNQSKKMINSSTTFQERPGSIDQAALQVSINPNLSATQNIQSSSGQGHRNYVKTVSKTDYNATNVDVALSGNVGQGNRVGNPGRRLLIQSNTNTGVVLSGRNPETNATLETTMGPNRRRVNDTHRYNEVSKNLFGSPTNAQTTSGGIGLSNSCADSNQQVPQHVRRRTINHFSSNTLQSSGKK